MKLGKGVEWAVHACALLALLQPKERLPREALAAFLGVPPQYLAKQLQALSRAGLVESQLGASGGYRLARPADQISLWDITAALEGTMPSFRCTEIRRNGPCGARSSECRKPCDIAAAFRDAEQLYRDALKARPLSEMVRGAIETAHADRRSDIKAWLQAHKTETSG